MAERVELTFTQANQDVSQCSTITIISDTITEGTESFIGVLTNSINISRLTLNPEMTAINIGDDTGEQVTLIQLVVGICDLSSIRESFLSILVIVIGQQF